METNVPNGEAKPAGSLGSLPPWQTRFRERPDLRERGLYDTL